MSHKYQWEQRMKVLETHNNFFVETCYTQLKKEPIRNMIETYKKLITNMYETYKKRDKNM
jgi:hypothetical protein